MEVTEEVQEKLMSYFETIESGVSKVGDFAADQLPLVVQEYLAWYFWSNIFTAFVCFLVSCVPFFIARRIYKSIKESDFTDGTHTDLSTGHLKHAFSVGFLVVALILNIPVIVHSKQALKAAVAPRVVVIDWIKSEIK